MNSFNMTEVAISHASYVSRGLSLFSVEYTKQTKSANLISGIVFAGNNDEWHEHRRFTLSTLKDFGMGKSRLQGCIHEEAGKLLEEFGSHKSQPFDPRMFINTHIANIICSMSFGGKFAYTDRRFQGMIRMIDENMK